MYCEVKPSGVLDKGVSGLACMSKYKEFSGQILVWIWSSKGSIFLKHSRSGCITIFMYLKVFSIQFWPFLLQLMMSHQTSPSVMTLAPLLVSTLVGLLSNLANQLPLTTVVLSLCSQELVHQDNSFSSELLQSPVYLLMDLATLNSVPSMLSSLKVGLVNVIDF